MSKPLIVNLGGQEIPLALSKVERADLYGYVEVETLDGQGRKCTTATLADDGRTLVGTGGAALVMLSPDGEWLEKKALVPTDNQGERITPVASSYAASVALTKTATIDEYLSHNIRSVYQVSSEADLGPLTEELKKGTIFSFPYSFRGGLEPDAGFLLLAADGTPFFAVGSPTKLEFVGFEQTAGVAAEEEEGGEDEEESLDFSMM
jgi:hypothetical protein